LLPTVVAIVFFWLLHGEYIATMVTPKDCARCHEREVAKHFYAEFIPELEELAGRHLSASDPAKKAAAEKLAKLLDETLNSSDHKWYLNKLDPAEKDLREQQRKDFQQRYAK
jgi:hypothetical protein